MPGLPGSVKGKEPRGCDRAGGGEGAGTSSRVRRRKLKQTIV